MFVNGLDHIYFPWYWFSFHKDKNMGDSFQNINVSSGLLYDVNTKEHDCEFKITQLYVNNTNEDICVVHRNNLPVVIRKASGYFGGLGTFVIRNIYHFKGQEQIVNTINNLQHLKKKASIRANELDIILAALLRAYDSDHRLINYSVALDKEVSVKTLRSHSSIYINEADVMLCDARSTMRCLHPYSEEGMIHYDYQGIVEQRRVSGVFLELIDNDNTVKTRYMYLAKQLIEIPAKQDRSKASGLYFTLADHDKLDEIHLTPRHLSFDEAETEVGLYKTQEEALSGGDPQVLSRIEEDRVKKELTELKRTMDLEKVQSERIKSENERTLCDLNQQLELQKQESARLKEELEERKIMRADYYEDRKFNRSDTYEQKSAERKDSTELLKFAAAAAAGAVAVITVMNKMNNK